jgi:hypothetical protein
LRRGVCRMHQHCAQSAKQVTDGFLFSTHPAGICGTVGSRRGLLDEFARVCTKVWLTQAVVCGSVIASAVSC